MPIGLVSSAKGPTDISPAQALDDPPVVHHIKPIIQFDKLGAERGPEHSPDANHKQRRNQNRAPRLTKAVYHLWIVAKWQLGFNLKGCTSRGAPWEAWTRPCALFR